MELKHADLVIDTLGNPEIDSPLKLSKIDGDFLTNYVEENERVLFNNSLCEVKAEMAGGREPLSFEKAGPREKIFFDPAHTRAGIVTCGGLCPGLNDVIRGLVMQMHFWYGVKNIYGFRYGYLGMVKESGLQPMVLDPDVVSEIHEKGGTILGSSRGPQNVSLMVDRLMDYNINILFCIGGDGTLRGAKEIHDEINKRGLAISVIGIPKTIDNDIGFIEKTFGFETAFTHAVDSIRTAHVEARGYQNGVGLVKLMGRQSGYITANASIASQDVNFCLIPEIPIDLDGENGFYKHLLDRIKRKNHAVIVVAEGVGDRFCSMDEKDVSGNRKSGDIGVFLRDGIARYFKERNVPVSLKYIDPSYIIRSSCAIPSDSIFCNQLAQNAVHAGMCGKTGMLVGIWNNCFTHVPIDISIRNRKYIDPESMFWLNVLESTGQPRWMQNNPRV
ncbi:MAG: diphosphate--fructose-6-phosphate 1-phosphotransferase [Candidatus Riflebacteria bacterium HGW-Riflebacteria-2]|jgi:6-phosphofructokinase 1|nr:MAG: diphosphate--fructose-6-phosphate 1-phosphotransferase [Candidatus Riflebacteria bacterium HGW-Riflebacteria-2]